MPFLLERAVIWEIFCGNPSQRLEQCTAMYLPVCIFAKFKELIFLPNWIKGTWVVIDWKGGRGGLLKWKVMFFVDFPVLLCDECIGKDREAWRGLNPLQILSEPAYLMIKKFRKNCTLQCKSLSSPVLLTPHLNHLPLKKIPNQPKATCQ